MTMRGFGRNQAMDLLKASIACALGAALVGCESTSSHFVAHKPLVVLASTQGDVRELEIRAGFLHLEATCDVENDAVCRVAAAELCSTPPSIYDRQTFRDGTQGEWRNVWLAQCEPRKT